jgi:preprotein translocase subunit SecB
MMAPVNFDALYAEAVRQAQDQAAAAADAEQPASETIN